MAAKKPQPSGGLDAFLERASAPRQMIAVFVNWDLYHEFEQAQAELAGSQQPYAGMLDSPPDADKLSKRVKELAEQVAAETLMLTVRGIGSRAWRDLIGAHPPTDEQVEKAKKAKQQRPGLNEETFWPAALAACCVTAEEGDGTVHDGVSPEWAARLLDVDSPVPESLRAEIYTALRRVNEGGGAGPKAAAAFATARASAKK